MGKKSKRIPSKSQQGQAVATANTPDSLRLVQQAEKLWRSGRRQQAQVLLGNLLKSNPKDVHGLHLSAIFAAESGDPERALTILEEAITLNQRDPSIRLTFGNILNAVGLFEKAEEAFRKALKRQPNFPQANNGLGMALSGQKRHREAVKYYEMAIRQSSGFVFAYSNLGAALLEAGDSKEAVKILQNAVDLEPGNSVSQKNLGTALMQIGDAKSAMHHFQQAIKNDPADLEASKNLAIVALKSGRLEESELALQRILSKEPTYKDARLLYGDVLFEKGHYDASVEQYRSLGTNDADMALGHIKIGKAYSHLGRFTDAAESYKQALEIDPALSAALTGLARITKSENSLEIMEQMESLLESQGMPENVSVHLHFALGKSCDDAGLFEKGFKHYKKGNGLRKTEYDPMEHHEKISNLIDDYSSSFFEKWKGVGDDSIRSVFVLGMPRSGTTLTEQVLASHPSVYGGGEQEYFPDLRKRVGHEFSLKVDGSVSGRTLGKEDIKEMRDDYKNYLDRLNPDALRIVDKMPHNFLNIGLIKLLMPKAKIIHARRNPIDNCLSIYFQNFNDAHDYSFDLTNLGTYYKEYERLMAHWESLFPGEMLEHRYEDMVADQEKMSRRLIDYIELEWDDACLQFHKTERVVKTASIWQARQKIYTSSVERWRNYEPYLGPLKEALGIE